MEKKLKRCIFIVIMIILIITGVVVFIIQNTKITENKTEEIDTSNVSEKIKKGYEVLGVYFCFGHSTYEMAGQAFTGWNCEICGYHGEYHNTAVPTLCNECANITGRCAKCGNIESKFLLIILATIIIIIAIIFSIKYIKNS